MEHFIEEYLLYLRKSRSDGEKVPIETILQRHEATLQELAEKELGYRIPEKNIYREIVSGGEAIEDRPEFIKVLQRLEVGNIKGVFVVDPQRLSRSGIYGAGDVLEAFEITQTLICTPMKFYNLDEPMDKKYLEMMMIQAAEYLNYSKQVMNNGRMRSFYEGKVISRPPFGYDKEKLKDEKGYKLIPHPIEAPHVQTIFDLCCEGLGATAIANYLNDRKIKPRKNEFFEPSTIRDILSNETYIGFLTWGKNPIKKILENGKAKKKRFYKQPGYKISRGLHEPLITKEQFELAQQMRKNRATPSSHNKGIQNPLAGFVKCGYCGNAMIRRPYNKSFKKHPIRVYEIDKEALLEYLRFHKGNSKYSLSEIAKRLNVTRDVVIGWFPPNIKKFYPSQTLAEKWFDLKELLEIQDNKFDKEVTTYKEPEPPKDTLMCSSLNCHCVSSQLEIVEKAIVDKLKEELNQRKHFLANYEQELKVEVVSNKKELATIEKEIEELESQLKTSRRKMIKEVITEEDFLELREEIEEELKPLKQRYEELQDAKPEQRITQYKRSIPIIEKCLDDYYNLSIEERNDNLKVLIDKVVYKKEEGGRWNKEAINNFELDIETYDF